MISLDVLFSYNQNNLKEVKASGIEKSRTITKSQSNIAEWPVISWVQPGSFTILMGDAEAATQFRVYIKIDAHNCAARREYSCEFDFFFSSLHI